MSDLNVSTVEVNATDSSVDNAAIDRTNASQATDSIRAVKRSKIKVDRLRNPRKEKRYTAKELSVLVRSILANGLLEPLTVAERANGELWVLKGHRRLAAYDVIVNEGLAKDNYGPAIPANPAYADTLKCRVLKGLSIEAEMDLVMDHADVLVLDKQEKLLTAKILTRFGFSHDFIAKKVGGTRSNYSNGLARVLELPAIVEATYLSEEDNAPNVSQEALKPLKTAYDLDRKEGSPVKVAGPRFQAAWEEFLKNDKLPTLKSMARKDLLSVCGVESDPDLRDLLSAIADNNKSDLGASLERLRMRIESFDTIGTGLVRIEGGIESTVGEFNRVD